MVSRQEDELKQEMLFSGLAVLLLTPEAFANKPETSIDLVEPPSVASVSSSILTELASQTEYHEQTGSGYEDTGHRVQGMLFMGAESWQSLTLDEGTYRVVGTCSNSCLDVNLQLFAGDVNIYEDMLDDDFPYLDFSVVNLFSHA